MFSMRKNFTFHVACRREGCIQHRQGIDSANVKIVMGTECTGNFNNEMSSEYDEVFLDRSVYESLPDVSFSSQAD